MQVRKLFEVHYLSVYGTYEIFVCKAKDENHAVRIAKECVGALDYDTTLKVLNK